MQKRLTMLRYLSLQNSRYGEHLKEITHGGADVVIDCVGMDGKNRH